MLDDRLDAATPGAVKAMIDEAAAPFTSEADEALRMSTPNGGQTPTQQEIAEWIASGNDMQELEASIASLWGMDAGKVKVTSWALGGLMVWRDGLEVHAPAELLRGSVRDNKTNPLAILIRDPGPRLPRPKEYWDRLIRAIEALDAMDARLPWYDPKTGGSGLRRVVSVVDIPRGPGALDDYVRIIVDLPPGSGPGPVVTPSLGWWGTRSAPAYNALLNLAYLCWIPGKSIRPVDNGRWWTYSQNPYDYPELTDSLVTRITKPLSARADRRHVVSEGWATIRTLVESGEYRIIDRHPIPIARPQ